MGKVKILVLKMKASSPTWQILTDLGYTVTEWPQEKSVKNNETGRLSHGYRAGGRHRW
jgi:hypothetical protein